METYRCNNCNRFVAKIIDKHNMQFKGKSITVENDNIIVRCKCGHVIKINMKNYID